MQQMKDHGKNPPSQANKEKILSSPKKELGGMIVKMIQNLGNKMEAQISKLEALIKKMQELFNKDLEELKNRQSIMNNTEMKQ